MSEDLNDNVAPPREESRPIVRRARPSVTQVAYLACGVGQAGGKLPLFDRQGQRFSAQTIRSCIERGWAEPWFDNPIKPDWLVCKLTEDGRAILARTRTRSHDNVVALIPARLAV